tara:strand:+ start:714 stop:947 length:234 start_codon:yes stop_codon:yes gene_type:complete
MAYNRDFPLADTFGSDKPKKKRKVVRGTFGFGIDGKEVEVEGKMITKRSGKKKFKPKSRKDKKMFRVIDRNKIKNKT